MKLSTIAWLFISLVLASARVLGQDLIIKNDKTELSVQVAEITDDMVKYKLFNRLNGPLYNLRKADIFVIIYQDGSRETFTQVRPANAPLAQSAYRESPRSTPAQSSPAVAQETGVTTAGTPAIKSRGGYFGLGYMTTTEALGEVHGYTIEYGYYWLLGQRKTVGIMLDCAYMDFFPKDAPSYSSVMLNSFFRTSPTSKFYLGSGVGYGQVGFPVYDRYGNSKKTYVGDMGGKAFLGIGVIRATLVWPTFESSSGSLFTIGFYSNPFK